MAAETCGLRDRRDLPRLPYEDWDVTRRDTDHARALSAIHRRNVLWHRGNAAPGRDRAASSANASRGLFLAGASTRTGHGITGTMLGGVEVASAIIGERADEIVPTQRMPAKAAAPQQELVE